MGSTRIGISGWTFPPWRGSFYPKGLPHRQELEHASRSLGSIEINGTFYSLQKPASFQNWHDSTPESFVFAVKAPQYITHIRRLKEIEEPLANFFASGLLCLGKKLGPILWQFPPNVMLKDDRFEKFLELLPKTSAEGARLAQKHGPKVKGRAWTKAAAKTPLRHAFEFRHKSFQDPAFLKLMKEHNAGLVLSYDHPRWPELEEHTADFVYARLHGTGMKRGYSAKQLAELAAKAEKWGRRRDVFVYFSNEAKESSPKNALQLMEQMGVAAKKKAA
jgi:uncharacterized protein YecE (DUF72 family)